MSTFTRHLGIEPNLGFKIKLQDLNFENIVMTFNRLVRLYSWESPEIRRSHWNQMCEVPKPVKVCEISAFFFQKNIQEQTWGHHILILHHLWTKFEVLIIFITSWSRNRGIEGSTRMDTGYLRTLDRWIHGLCMAGHFLLWGHYLPALHFNAFHFISIQPTIFQTSHVI